MLLMLFLDLSKGVLVLVSLPSFVEVADLLVEGHRLLTAFEPEGDTCLHSQNMQHVIRKLSLDSGTPNDVCKAI